MPPGADPFHELPASETADLVRSHDWAATPLGPVRTWPAALVNTVRTVLACRLPMYVAWGAELTQIYNDAYRPILGDKHPALGRSTPQTWPEIWPKIGPMWQEVLSGKPIGFDDFKLTLNRFGHDEDCFFNFSYSPVYDDAGKAAGVLVTFAETTEKIRTADELRVQQRNLQLALDAADMGWWHYDPAREFAHWDRRFADIYGMEGDSGSKEAAFGRIVAEDRDRVRAAVEASVDARRRERLSVDYRIQHPTRGLRCVEARGLGSFAEGQDRAMALVGTARDVTDDREGRQALQDSEVRSKATAERLSLALDAAHMGDWSWDAETDVVTMSPRAAEIFGIEPGPRMTWTGMRALLHPEDAPRAELAVQRAVNEKNDYDIEYRLAGPGPERWVMARGRPVYDAAGQPKAMIGVVQEVTEAKALQQALLARTTTLEGLLDTAEVITAERDTARVVQHVTDTATRITRAEFGAFFYNVLDDRGGSYMLYALSGVDPVHFSRFPMPRATALFGPTFRGEGVIRSDDIRADARYGKSKPYHGMPPGHLPVVSYLAVPVISRSGEVMGGLFFGHSQRGVFKEAHEQAVQALAAQAAVAMDNARLHDRARQNLEVAENAARMKDEFLATVSHELRTPLTSLVGWIHMLKSGKLGAAEHQRALESLERNVKAQQRIFDDILDVSRIVAGKLRIELTPIEVVASIEGAIESLQPLIEAKRIDLVRMFDSAVVILGDASRMQQVVWNLLSNAIKYTPRGGRIKVILRQVESQVELRVADNGEGIDAAFLPHVFERFRQADSTTTRAHGGIGLGLAIVRHLVELHGGTATAHSEGRGKGSEFVVRLPLAPAGAAWAGQARAGESAAAPRDWNLRGVKALVLDDEQDTRVMLAAVLGSAGICVTTAGSVAEALALLEAQAHDIVISDIGMPAEDGYAFVRRLRQHAARSCRELPAVALTAYARPEDRVQTLSSGFQAHLAKPAQPEELLATVASLLGRATPLATT